MISLVSVALIVGGTVMLSILYVISLQPKALSLRFGETAYRQCGLVRYGAMLFEGVTLAGYILFTFGTTFNYLLARSPATTIRIIGAVFAAVCLAFMTYATVKAGRESAVPSQETTLHHGIYDVMRHPQTLGEMLSWFGISMILNSLTLLLYSVIWLPLYIGFTIIEDNDLALRFGDEYLEYSKRVGMFWKKRRIK